MLVAGSSSTSPPAETSRTTGRSPRRSARRAAEELIAEGVLAKEEFPDFETETGYRAPQTEFIDDVTFDGTKPNEYLEKFPIGLKGDDKV